MAGGDVTRAFYLEGGAEPIFAMLDEPPENAARRSTAVLVCPPFGWQDVASYRPRRDWARDLAAAGHPALRIDLPGSGDSGGFPRDPGRFEAWAAAIGAAATWLRSEGGCARVAAVGVGITGLALYRAATDGAPIDDLVLWGASARGRSLAREQRAVARLEAAQQPETEAPIVPEGALTAAGFLLSAQTLADLQAFDVSELPAPTRTRRALLLERDGIGVDDVLASALTAHGVEVTIAPGDGFSMMFTAEPQAGRRATATLATVSRWLDATDGERLPDRSGGGPLQPVRAADHATMTGPDGGHLRETAIQVSTSHGNLVGILAEPLGPPRGLCLVMLNAGAQRRIGVNRMWVELARRWAERGLPSLRVDLAGIGDGDGDSSQFTDLNSFYVPEYVDQVRTVLDDLEDHGLPSRFVLLGLCSGAYWSLHTAVADRRVEAALMLNTRVLLWTPELLAARDADRVARAAASSDALRKLLAGELTADQLRNGARALRRQALSLPARSRAAVAARRRAAAGGRDEVEQLLDRLRDRGQRGLLLFTAEEPVYEELLRGGYLTQFGSWPNLTLAANERLRSGTGEDHTLRPLWLQQLVHEIVDAELERELVLLDHQTPGRGAQAISR